jgi:hypothetical protein
LAGTVIKVHPRQLSTPTRGFPLLSIGLAFGLGTGLFFLLPTMPPWWLPAPLLVLAVALATRRGPLSVWGWAWAWPLAAATFGLFWAHAQVCEVLCEPFPESLVGTTLVAEGRVASLPEQRQDSVRFLFRIDHLTLDGEPLAYQGLARLSWYRQPPRLLAGERGGSRSD